MRKNYRIGLDVGTNSLGWSVLSLDEHGTPNKIEDTGVRIFADGRVEKTNTTLAATRRTARLARRRRDRFKQRQIFLLDELTKIGLFPEGAQARKELQKEDPLKLRARALQEKLAPHRIGRALFHINQRRGFQSNRKDRSEEVTSGKISRSARRLLEEMRLIDLPMPPEKYKKLSKADKKSARQQEAKDRNSALKKLADKKDLTYGSFLYARQQQGKPTRARPATVDAKLYDVYPTREIYKDEFNKIWDAQAVHHPNLKADGLRGRIHHVIFTQRPLRPQKVGMCTYIKGEKRAFRSMPSFQRYRIFQEVNNLEWSTSAGKNRLIDFPAGRDAIIDLLENPITKTGSVGFKKMKAVLKNRDLAEGNFTFNFETPKRKGFFGNTTSMLMRSEDCVGYMWDKWSLDKQDKFVDTLLGKESDKEIKSHLMDDYDLTEYAAGNCLNATAKFDDGTASLSLKAAKLILDKMNKDRMIQPDAVEKVAKENHDFINPFTLRRDGELQDRLPYYGEVFGADGRHIIPGDRLDGDKSDERKYFGGVTNPTVHIALNQIRHVVNELIDRYGHPASIAIELGRNLPKGEAGRKQIEIEQKEDQDRNEKLDKTLIKHGQVANANNRLRLLLWEELNQQCPFSGERICISDLFNGVAEIEHLLPFSRSLDDSRANKVICFRGANREKGNRTPFEAFGDSPNGYAWDDIFERVQRLPKPKQWRFQKDAMEIWVRDMDFTARHLNDTRYIGRLAREYLECICPLDKIDVLTGRLTALLRRHWGLNSVLKSDINSQVTQDQKNKNRNDHRHHAIDAIVIGMTSRTMLQKVSSAARHAEELQLESIFEKSDNKGSAIDPWGGFRADVRESVRKIIVSHKIKRKKEGELHRDTALGIINTINEERNEYQTVVRRPIDYLTKPKRIAAIRSPSLRQGFCQAFKKAVADKKKGVEGIRALALKKGIRRVRCFGPKQAIPIKDKDGTVYKGYQSHRNWGMEIYEYPANPSGTVKRWKAGQWKGVVISRFDANKPDFKPGQSYRPHPAARLVMRLQINDCVEIEKGGAKSILRLQKMNQGGLLFFAPLKEANVDSRDSNRDVIGTYRGQKFKGRKVRDTIAFEFSNGEKRKKTIDDLDLHWVYEDDFFYFTKSADRLKEYNLCKVHISPTGKISNEVRRKSCRKC